MLAVKVEVKFLATIRVITIESSIELLCTHHDTAGTVMQMLVKTVEYTIDKTLIIAFAGIDSKALRIAEDNNIQVWKRDDVNFLMKLCGKIPILL